MSDTKQLHSDTPLLEWILGAIGFVIFVAGVGMLVVRGAASEVAPGVQLQVERVIPVDNGHLVQFVARNTGSETLADLHLSAALMDGAREVERVDMTLDYLPGRSERKGGAYFKQDPNQHRVELTADGYQTLRPNEQRGSHG